MASRKCSWSYSHICGNFTCYILFPLWIKSDLAMLTVSVFLPRGFADIPTGKTSPYVLRRTTMPTRTSPRLAAQKLAQSPLSLNKENHAETSQPTAGGSRSQKVTPMNLYPPFQIQEMTVLPGQGFDTAPFSMQHK